MRSLVTASAFGLLLLLTGCFAPSKADIIKKAEGASTSSELEAVLGEPSEVSKFGPLEKWTYKAADGAVIFLIAADTITFEVTD